MPIFWATGNIFCATFGANARIAPPISSGISMAAVERAWAGILAGYAKALEVARSYREVFGGWVARVGKKRLQHHGLIALGAIVVALVIRWRTRPSRA